MLNIREVVSRKLCTGCGICKGICPVCAIEMMIDEYGIFTPQIDSEKCVDCELCMKVCPGHEFDYVHHMQKLHGKLPDNVAIGPIIKAYAGYAADKSVLDISQSGGFVSALLIYGIENKLFDGAVVTSWNEKNPFEPSVYIAKTKDEVLKAVGSKYNPVPVAAIANKILKSDGRYAFVGTPCQIQGMRKAEDYVKGLADKIALYVGLHCLSVFNYHYHDQILHKIKKAKSEISYFRFRDKKWRGWPCDMLLKTKSGETVNLTGTFSRLDARSYFSNWRCQLCFDKFNEFSDVSCGDCRIPIHYGKSTMSEAYYHVNGKSDIVIRSVRANDVIEKMIADRVLYVEESEIKALLSSVAIAEKKIGVNYAKRFIEKIGGTAPDYGVKFDICEEKNRKINKAWKNYSELVAGHYYFCHSMIKYRAFTYLLKITPHKLLGRWAVIRHWKSIQFAFRNECDIRIVANNEKTNRERSL